MGGMADSNPTSSRRRATLRDIAKDLGVSKTTVSNAFSRPDQLSAELRARVLSGAREAGYHGPDPVARMLRTRRAGALGLVFPESLTYAFEDPTAVELLRGVADACEERGMALLIVPRGRRATEDTAEQRAAHGAVVDGFLAYSLPRGSVLLQHVLERRLPVVLIDQPRLEGLRTVGIDDRGGAAEAGRHLLNLGHRLFGIVTLPGHPEASGGPMDAARIVGSLYDVTASRMAGYRDALGDAGIELDQVPVYEGGRNDDNSGRSAGQYLLSLSPRPSAILAMGDRLALGVLDIARELGLKIPRDLSIVGFDGIPATDRSRPALTTIRQPLHLKGYVAARLLLDDIDMGEGMDETSSKLLTELIVRGTTGPAPT